MRRIGSATKEALYGAAATRALEQVASAALAPHSLMARAGQSVAQLASALAPHARRIWIACGPGNNSGDGLIAALHLHRRALACGSEREIVVTLCGDTDRLPPDAAHAWRQMQAAGMTIADHPPASFDLAIDALLGIGTLRAPEGLLANHLQMLMDSSAPVLCVDLPSGLNADTGAQMTVPWQTPLPGPRHTLSLLTLKPGLFTGDGRDRAGQVWFDDLGVSLTDDRPPQARLNGMAWDAEPAHRRAHASHKGSQGDVLVMGGQHIGVSGAGMTGAAMIAARAALHSGAGRVYVSLLNGSAPDRETDWDPACPELMFRRLPQILQSDLMAHACVVCGCGGGELVAALLPAVLSQARTLVLDADALNAIAGDQQLQALLRQRGESGRPTVITPHPLEAARLLGSSTAEVMADRLAATQRLVDRFKVVCVLKGSGTIIGSPGQTPWINPTGNALLATAGTGDVLAGMIGGALAAPRTTPDSLVPLVCAAVLQHGWLADHWPEAQSTAPSNPTLTADRLAQQVRSLR